MKAQYEKKTDSMPVLCNSGVYNLSLTKETWKVLVVAT